MIFSSWPVSCAAIAASKVAGEDALVLGEQVVGVLVEVADAADHRGPGDDVIAVAASSVSSSTSLASPSTNR